MMNEDSFTLPFHEIGLWSSELGLPQETSVHCRSYLGLFTVELTFWPRLTQGMKLSGSMWNCKLIIMVILKKLISSQGVTFEHFLKFSSWDLIGEREKG